MADLAISALPSLADPLDNNAMFAIAQDGTTYKLTLLELSASLILPGGGGATVDVDGTTIEGNGSSTPLAVINPLPPLGSNGQVLTIVGGVAVWTTPAAALALNVQHNSTLTGNGTLASLLAVTNPLPAPGTNGQVLQIVSSTPTWATLNVLPTPGSNGQILTVVSGVAAWADYLSPAAVAVNSSLTGNGTLASPLGINATGAAAGEYLQWTGSAFAWAIPLGAGGADDWGSQVVEIDGTLTGDGTSGTPLSVAFPVPDPTLVTDGWVLTADTGVAVWAAPSSGADDWGSQVVEIDGTLTGDGTSGTPLAVAFPVPDPTAVTDGWVLTADTGAAIWAAPGSGADDWGSQVVETDGPLTGDGTIGSPLSIALAFTLPITVDTYTLRYNGSIWVATSGIKVDASGNVGIQNATPTTANAVTVEANQKLWMNGKTTVTSDGLSHVYGLKSEATGANTAKNNVAGWFVADNSGGGNAFALRLQDGTEGTGKILLCPGTDGNAIWADPTNYPWALPSGAIYQTLAHDGTSWEASDVLHMDGDHARIGTGIIQADIVLTVYANTEEQAIHGVNKTLDNSNPAQVAVGVCGVSTVGRDGINVAGCFIASNATTPANAYALRLRDGGELANKVFKCVDGDGHGMWDTVASALTGGTAPTITGSKGGNAALASLLTALHTLGIINDTTT